jgi:hypothetical protein
MGGDATFPENEKTPLPTAQLDVPPQEEIL